MAKVFARHGLRLEVEMSTGKVGKNPEYPVLKASSWIQTLDATGHLGNLLGFGCHNLEDAGSRLLDFWDKYALSHGDHEVFALSESGTCHSDTAYPSTFTGMRARPINVTGPWFSHSIVLSGKELSASRKWGRSRMMLWP